MTGKEEDILTWYTRTYPDDESVVDIDPSLTFEGVMRSLTSGILSSGFLGGDDVVLRTRVLVELSRRSRVPFSAIEDACSSRKALGFEASWND